MSAAGTGSRLPIPGTRYPLRVNASGIQSKCPVRLPALSMQHGCLVRVPAPGFLLLQSLPRFGRLPRRARGHSEYLLCVLDFAFNLRVPGTPCENYPRVPALGAHSRYLLWVPASGTRPGNLPDSDSHSGYLLQVSHFGCPVSGLGIALETRSRFLAVGARRATPSGT